MANVGIEHDWNPVKDEHLYFAKVEVVLDW
jgi:hypothetical protein